MESGCTEQQPTRGRSFELNAIGVGVGGGYSVDTADDPSFITAILEADDG